MTSGPGNQNGKTVCIIQWKETRSFRNLHDTREAVQRVFDSLAKIMCFEVLSFLEQVQVSDPCLLLFAPHGAGMTNTVVLRRVTAVIEFFLTTTNQCSTSL